MNDKESHIIIDGIEREIKKYNPANCPLHHIFTPHLYTRHIFMPAGTLIVSKIHRFQHPYDVMCGIAWVKINDGEWERIEGPYSGITEAGTRRVLFIEKDCWWKTSHVVDIYPEDDSDKAIKEAVKKIENIIIIKRNRLKFDSNNSLQLIDLQ